MKRLLLPLLFIIPGRSVFAQDSIAGKSVIFHTTIITMEHHRKTGYLYNMTDSTLLLSGKRVVPDFKDFSAPDGLVAYDYRKIQYVELSPKGQVWATTAFGLVLGAAIGALVGYSTGDDPKENLFALTAGQKALYVGAFGGAVGAISGFIVGMAVRKTFLIRGRKESYTRMRKKMAARLGF